MVIIPRTVQSHDGPFDISTAITSPIAIRTMMYVGLFSLRTPRA